MPASRKSAAPALATSLAAAPVVQAPRTVQTKMTALIIAAAERHGFEVVKAANWSNTGTLHIQPVDGFESVVSIPYDFQSNTMTLRLSHRSRNLVPRRQAHRTDGYVDWYMPNDAAAEIREFLTALDAALARDPARTGG